MKKSILLSLGILYTGISLGYTTNPAPEFSTVSWSKVVPGYISSDSVVLDCGMKDNYYTCWIIPSDTIYDQTPDAHVWFKLASDQSQYCEYDVRASWDTQKVKYNFYTTFLYATPGIKCQTYQQDMTIWYINQ